MISRAGSRRLGSALLEAAQARLLWSRSVLRGQRTLVPQREILLDLSFELNKDAVQFDFSAVGVVAH